MDEALEREPWKFHLFQALRRIECAHAERPRLGESRRAADDPVRLGQTPSMAFAPASLSSYGREGDAAPRLDVLVLGLFGPNGPMPLHVTEYAFDRLHNAHDPTLARFADVFHHRMLSLFYRAWAAAQPTVQHDRPARDAYARWLGALVGIGLPTLQDRGEVPDAFRLHHAGHFAGRTRPPEVLARLLEDFVRVPVRVREFVGHWLPLPARFRCRLGDARGASALGTSATLGERIWDVQGRMRIVVGPVGWSDFQRFLPGGRSVARLTELVRDFVHREFDWDVQVLLKRDEVPGASLGDRNGLGWSTWLLSEPARRDADDYVAYPEPSSLVV
ncbi:MAG TPA: type VI secretion system baseplate subunit TssG [Polyangiaceae bacterium]|nr:type VI secretion system baseplate subunit TssG [Polyangiaceae bacterium]